MLYMGIECAHIWNFELLTSKNSAKLKQYYYFHAEFLEEVRYPQNKVKPST